MPSDQNLGISWLSQLGQPVTNSAEGLLSFEPRMGGARALRDLDSTWGVGGPSSQLGVQVAVQGP